jgi:hypothetical protein
VLALESGVRHPDAAQLPKNERRQGGDPQVAVFELDDIHVISQSGYI